MRRTLGDITVELPGSWVDHSIYRLTEPNPSDPFDRYESKGAEKAAVDPGRRSLWTCWLDCPQDLVGDALAEQSHLFEHGYLLVSEHVPDRPDILDVTTLAYPTYRHPTYGKLEAIHIRFKVRGKRVDEIHCYLPDDARQRILVVTYSFPSQDKEGPSSFEQVLQGIEVRQASTAELMSRWGKDSLVNDD